MVLVALQNVQGIATRKAGMNYKEILDLVKQGKAPIGHVLYARSRESLYRKFSAYLPAASNIHGSYASPGVSFSEASKEYGARYRGYHVSEDKKTDEKILFPLAKTLLGPDGKETDVLQAKNCIILMNLVAADGTPANGYEYDKGKNETLITIGKNARQVITHFPSKTGWWVFSESGEFKAPAAGRHPYYDPDASLVVRAEGVNWNGIFFLGAEPTGQIDRCLFAYLMPSDRAGVLATKIGADTGPLDPRKDIPPFRSDTPLFSFPMEAIFRRTSPAHR